MKAAGIHPGGKYQGALGAEGVVTGVLLLRLLLSAGDHEGAPRQGKLLGGDTGRDRILLLNLLMAETCGQKTTQLFAAEGMTGEDQRDAQPLRQQRPHVAGIGVVGMNPVRPTGLRGDASREQIGQRIEMGPEQLFAEIAARAEGEAHDRGSIGQRFPSNGVIGGESPVLKEPGHQLKPLHLRPSGQAADQLKDIGGLTTGIGITTEFRIMATQQAMQVQVQQKQTHQPPGTQGIPSEATGPRRACNGSDPPLRQGSAMPQA